MSPMVTKEQQAQHSAARDIMQKWLDGSDPSLKNLDLLEVAVKCVEAAEKAVTQPIISVAINNSYGGFSLSQKAAEAVLQRKGIGYRLERAYGDTYYPFIGDGWETAMDVCTRHDPDLIAVIREMGTEAGSSLEIIDFKIGVDISDHDGKETAKVYGQRIWEQPGVM